MKVKEIIKFTEWIPNPRKAQNPPKFSILMPVYRRYASGHLTRAIQSVLDQTYGEFELIIVDDCSVDGSFEEVQRFMKLDARVHCLHHPRNVGLPAIGCYEAYLKSRGEYLMFCFDDTQYQKDALEKVERYVSEYKPKISFGYIDLQYYDPSGNVAHSFLGKEKISQADLKITNFFPNLGAILHRDVLAEIGFLDPHMAITRLTDWDYWKRAANFYELYYSDIFIGTEFGLVTGSSLGMTYPFNQWQSYELTAIERNFALTPSQYEEYDVQYTSDELSDLSKLAILDMAKFFEGKFWCQPQEPLKISTNSLVDELGQNTKILVVTGAQSASVTLTYEFIQGAEKNIRYVSPVYHEPVEMFAACAVIFVRDLFNPLIIQWIEFARKLGIPHYFYLDDNFMILNREIPELRGYTEKKVRRGLASFSGVLVSSQKLATFFSDNNIHSKIHVFPPVMPFDKWLDQPRIPKKPDSVTRIGFMGGPHRVDEFIQIVLPAVKRLANKHKIELIVSGDHKIPFGEHAQLQIYQFPFDTSYRLALGRMQSAEIDILVHSGSITSNNPYKTRNVLINAWALNAIPLLSNQPPYEDVEEMGIGMLCEIGSVDAWFEQLLKIMSEPSFALQVRENLDKYVRENYSGKQNLDVLKTIAKENNVPGISIIENRFRSYISIIRNGIPIEDVFGARSAIRLVRKLDYRLHTQALRWTGFEFMIGTHGQNASGQIEVEVIDRVSGIVVRRKTLDLKDIRDNQAVSVEFEEISDSADKHYIVRFNYYSLGKKSVISVYEANDTDSKIRHVLRRLGVLTRGNTLACRLLYAEE